MFQTLVPYLMRLANLISPILCVASSPGRSFLMREKRCAVSLKALPEQLKRNRTHQKGCICLFFLHFTIQPLGSPDLQDFVLVGGPLG